MPEGLARRVVTAGALLAAFLAALWLLEPRALALLISVVVALAAFEWGSLAGFDRRAAAIYALSVGTLCALTIALIALSPSWREPLLATGAALWLVAVPAWLFGTSGRPARSALAIAGVMVLVLTGVAALAVSATQLLLILGLVWLADTAAYFAGNAFGRHRLAPSISPAKTWEGVAGALSATLLYAIICALPGMPLSMMVQGAAQWAGYLCSVAVLCGVSIMGDLFESALKRQAGAKDSGSLLPGHGGILDRIDSALPTLPIAALLLAWAG